MTRSMRASGKRDHSLALGILVVAILMVLAAIIAPVWLLHRHYDGAIDDLSDRLSRYQRISGTRPQLVQGIEAMRVRDPRKSYLKAATPPLAAAEMQELVKNLIEANGGKVITAQVQSPREEGRYRQVSVNLQFTANMLALRRILNGLETGQPILFADNVVIRTQVPSTFKPAPGGEPEMFVQLDVIGYTLGAS
jgi:general secretion pathway protein M